jgi:hypothetical protein
VSCKISVNLLATHSLYLSGSFFEQKSSVPRFLFFFVKRGFVLHYLSISLFFSHTRFFVCDSNYI